MEQKTERKPRSDTGDKADRLKKPLGVGQLLQQKVELFDLMSINNALYQALGNVQPRGVWLIWGNGGSGKSSFFLDLLKALGTKYRCLHVEREEETDDDDFLEKIRFKELSDVTGNYMACSYNLNQLTRYLDQRGSPEVVAINSATYLFKNKEEYFEFTRRYKRKKIIIITAHAKGKNPKHDLEEAIMYDANKKIFVDGYLATCKGRKIGPNGGTYIIWQEGYEKIHGVQDKNNPDDNEH